MTERIVIAGEDPSVPPEWSHAPDMVGAGGWRAWRIDRAAALRAPHATKDHQASIAAWLVHCPGAHAAWSWWTMSVVHLRPIEGARPAEKQYPEAEYEFSIITLDPSHAPSDPRDWTAMRFLTPLDAVVQFHGVTDAQAEGVLEAAVRAVMSGHVSPDQDFRGFWERSIPATARHFQEGAH